MPKAALAANASKMLTESHTRARCAGKVEGNLQAACQQNIFGTCVAVCIEGGPITRVESANMDEIVTNVNVRGRHTEVEVKRLTFAQLMQEAEDHEASAECAYWRE